MRTGKVKRWDETRGFGFIGRIGEPDLYVHISALSSKAIGLKEGDEVSFETMETARGLRAMDVRVLRREPAPLSLKPRLYTQRAD